MKAVHILTAIKARLYPPFLRIPFFVLCSIFDILMVIPVIGPAIGNQCAVYM